MLIREIIYRTKSYYRGIDAKGHRIDDETTRDKVLFGNVDLECTGIAVTCFASVEVIQQAIENKVNLIICHEALFWNHGDKTDWLQDNTIYQQKLKLLEDHKIVVWRNHDYIHSGLRVGDRYHDGIFYGVINRLQWEDYAVSDFEFKFPGIDAQEISRQLIEKLNLNGIRITGDASMQIKSLIIPGHIMGNDQFIIEIMEKHDVDGILGMEVIDYTVSEYIRDSSYLGRPRIIFGVGHFNFEEYGMEYMLNYLPEIVEEPIPQYFFQSGDSFTYQLAE